MSFEGIYESLPLKLTLIVTCLLLLIIGNALWFGIIHFEKFGGDPQKRSLANILSSYASIGCSVLLTSTVGIHLARVFFGCELPECLAYIMVFIRRLFNTLVISFVLEILLYKMIQVYRYYIVANLNDSFFGIFLAMTTFLNSLIFNVSLVILVEPRNPMLDLLACHEHPKQVNDVNKFVASISMVAFGICLLQILMTLGKKLYEINKDNMVHVQAWSSSSDAETGNLFNNQRWNKALASSGQFVMILIIYIFGAATQLLVPIEQVIENPWMTFPRHFTLPFINGILVPALFYVSNKNARKHAKELYRFD